MIDDETDFTQSTDWRTLLAKREIWRVGSADSVPQEDWEELFNALTRIVPTRTRGDGLEKFEDWVLPHHTDTFEDYCAAALLHDLREKISESRDKDNGLTLSRSFETAVRSAFETLEHHGIAFRGLRGTLLFWSNSRRRLVQMDQDLGRKLYTRECVRLGYRFFSIFYDRHSELLSALPWEPLLADRDEDLPPAYEWRSKYPWRGKSMTLAAAFRHRMIEPFSPLWYAVNILMRYDELLSLTVDLRRDLSGNDLSKLNVVNRPLKIAQLGYEIGRSEEALIRKNQEYAIVANEQAKSKRGKAGGVASASNKERRIKAFMEQIEVLSKYYPEISEDRIVGQAFDKAVKNDPELWSQGQGQMEEYLSKDIRSREPYKSRYYRIFGKTA